LNDRSSIIKRNDRTIVTFVDMSGTNDPNYRAGRLADGSDDIRLMFAPTGAAAFQETKMSIKTALAGQQQQDGRMVGRGRVGRTGVGQRAKAKGKRQKAKGKGQRAKG
jgi:hypothetical protein